ncbi:MAG: efflux RND transporter periplasmic adaptor subunit [Patescibacteria group bacterium]
MVSLISMSRGTKIITAILSIAAVAAVAGIALARRKHVIPYLTEKVTRGDLVQTVSASGKVKSSTDVSLSFAQNGRVASIWVKEGDKVKIEQPLLTLDSVEAETRVAEARASVAAARADVDKLIAGASLTERQLASVTVENARNNLTQARIRTEADSAKAAQALVEARAAVSMSETNLQEDLVAAVTDAKTAADTVEKKTQGAINTLEEIFDAGNDFYSYFTINNIEAKENTKNAKGKADSAAKRFSSSLASFRKAPTETAVHQWFPSMTEELSVIRIAISKTSTALNDASVSSSAPKTLTAYRADIASAWTDLNASIADLNDADIDLTTARFNGEATLNLKKAAASTAEKNLKSIQAQAQTILTQTEGDLKSAEAQYQKTIAPPTKEEMALLQAKLNEARASLATAQDALEKTILKSPLNGIITNVEVKVGEAVSPTVTVIRLLTEDALEITVQTPEADIPKVQVDDSADITLDAFGSDRVFTGKVTFINPAETIIEGVVYYEVTVAFDKAIPEIKPGMSADVVMHTDECHDVLSVPLRAVKEREKSSYVEIMKGLAPEERTVIVGLRGDGGRVEITNGLQEGEVVVIGTKKK